jgi:hypothetical protein
VPLAGNGQSTLIGGESEKIKAKSNEENESVFSSCANLGVISVPVLALLCPVQMKLVESVQVATEKVGSVVISEAAIKC